MRVTFLLIGSCVGLMVGLSDSPIVGAVVTAALAFVPAVYQRFSSTAPPEFDKLFLKETFSLVLFLVIGITGGALSGLAMKANNVLVKQGIVRDYEAFIAIGASQEQAIGFVGAAFNQGNVSSDVALRSGTAFIDATNRQVFHDNLRTIIRSINNERLEADQPLSVRLMATNQSAIALFEILRASMDAELSDEGLLLWSDYFFLAEDEEQQWISGLNALQRGVFGEVLSAIR